MSGYTFSSANSVILFLFLFSSYVGKFLYRNAGINLLLQNHFVPEKIPFWVDLAPPPTPDSERLCAMVGWLVDFGFNGPLRQYFSLYRAVSQRERERGERIDERKNVQTTPIAPTASAIGLCNGRNRKVILNLIVS